MSEAVNDNSLSDRKKEHIELALKSQLNSWSNDKRFHYEPLLGKHPGDKQYQIDLGGKTMRFPLWVSSMTGGTPEARKINERLAHACGEFGLGMGLGSCRILLEDPKFLEDFDVRQYMTDKEPLFANLGIAQIEKSLKAGKLDEIEKMVDSLKADGLIIHVNPLQEWLQPEGDRLASTPIDLIEQFLDQSNLNLIVKEVGQGMGKQSLQRLMKLPVIIEFAAYGGTNFSQLEITRRQDEHHQDILANIGHNLDEMIDAFNENLTEVKDQAFKNVIISGGVKDFLDGYYATQRLNSDCVYGQASGFLNSARESYEALQHYVQQQISGYNLATEYLRVRE